VSMRHALLALLSDGPSYGWKLRQDFEARTGEVWPVNGQVYTTLQRLERDGLIEADEAEVDGAQRRFQLTEGGRDELARWLQTPAELSAPLREDLVIKVMVALGLAHVDARALLQVHRRHLVEVMREYARVKDAAPDDVNLAMVADAEVFRLDAQVRWLDLVESTIAESGSQMRAKSAAGPTVLPHRRAKVGRRG
jgi:DNA-binding PadR family transcriptional regulator